MRRVTVQSVREGQAGYLASHYLVLQITVVSVALAIAGLSMASIIARPMAAGDALVWLLWLASLLATAVAYAGPMTGAFALPPSIPTIPDLLLPLAIGITEFLLFAVLIPQLTPSGRLQDVTSNWLWITSAFGVIAFLVTLRARYLLLDALRRGVYANDIKESIERAAKRLTNSLWGPAAHAFIAALGALLRMNGLTERWLAYLLVVLITVLLGGALLTFQGTAKLWRASLESGRSPSTRWRTTLAGPGVTARPGRPQPERRLIDVNRIDRRPARRMRTADLGDHRRHPW